MLKQLNEKGYKKGDPIYELFMSTQKMHFSISHSIMYLKKLEEELHNEDDLITKFIVHPQLANSLFLTIYSQFEKLLHDLCTVYKKEMKLTLSVDELKNKGVLRSINYLSKVVQLANIKTSEHYDLISHWNRVRNLIAHDTGIITEENQRKSLKRLNLIYVEQNEEEFVILSFDDCQRFFDTFFDYLYLLMKEKE
ncbi:hypothetical protein [Bacillus infantis]|uniref:hypothetical protein n=1 Tax=Bacillus infantis TaxID=324767 RepID=UPI003CE8F991